ncbi:MAG: hypothetical protein IT345_07800 [Trueperaceae bacterium]|nr:hypothetical protein [Trueperaceae bacterium]
MKQGLTLEVIETLEWVRDEFHRGGQQDAAARVDEILAKLKREIESAPSRPISTARLLQYVEIALRALLLWRNW